MREIRLKAYAKINLGLDVVRRREDGYHDVRMIMQTISLHDRLYMKRTRADGIRIKTNLGFLPADADNLAYQAAQLMMEEFHLPGGVFIDLEKHIPVAAGLAGGSSDAAAALVGMNALFDLGLTQEELMERGVKIGADVPYCIMRGTALAEGIGEKLTRLPRPADLHVVAAKPPVHVSTKYVYTHLKLDENTVHPDIDAQIRALGEQDTAAFAAHMGNVLESVTMEAHPVIGQLKEQLLADGAMQSMMSGSGPTVFALFEDEEKAAAACRNIRESGMARQVFTASFFHPSA